MSTFSRAPPNQNTNLLPIHNPFHNIKQTKHYDSDICVRTLIFFYGSVVHCSVKRNALIRAITMFSSRWNVAPYFKCNPLWVYTTAGIKLVRRRLQYSCALNTDLLSEIQLFASPKSCVMLKAGLQASKTRFFVTFFSKPTSLSFAVLWII